jgi:hypothetical protein
LRGVAHGRIVIDEQNDIGRLRHAPASPAAPEAALIQLKY